MRVRGLLATVVNVRGKTDVSFVDVLVDTMRRQQILSNPLPFLEPLGRVIGYDDLEGVLKWLQAAGTVTRDNTHHVANGNYCLKLLTGAVAGNEAYAWRYFPLLETAKIRFMCHWHTWGTANEIPPYEQPQFVRWRLGISDGTYTYKPELEYLNFLNTVDQEKWRYHIHGGGFEDVPGGSQHLHMGENDDSVPGNNFLLMDVEIAAGACTIKRIRSNNLNLTGLSLSAFTEESNQGPGISMFVQVKTDVDAAVAAYFDDLAVGDGALP